eukprot:TRINITY_DN1041_c0_g1_i1.p1 TRINITY_DN1041_c0_g1~~TRINITY_DN1041_c0_g1_i1.p1  ORF type:complete len:1140 (+),score=394.15 TRINITY_DN1041_c0_g1_i1:150-3569(+)
MERLGLDPSFSLDGILQLDFSSLKSLLEAIINKLHDHDDKISSLGENMESLREQERADVGRLQEQVDAVEEKKLNKDDFSDWNRSKGKEILGDMFNDALNKKADKRDLDDLRSEIRSMKNGPIVAGSIDQEDARGEEDSKRFFSSTPLESEDGSAGKERQGSREGIGDIDSKESTRSGDDDHAKKESDPSTATIHGEPSMADQRVEWMRGPSVERGVKEHDERADDLTVFSRSDHDEMLCLFSPPYGLDQRIFQVVIHSMPWEGRLAQIPDEWGGWPEWAHPHQHLIQHGDHASSESSSSKKEAGLSGTSLSPPHSFRSSISDDSHMIVSSNPMNMAEMPAIVTDPDHRVVYSHSTENARTKGAPFKVTFRFAVYDARQYDDRMNLNKLLTNLEERRKRTALVDGNVEALVAMDREIAVLRGKLEWANESFGPIVIPQEEEHIGLGQHIDHRHVGQDLHDDHSRDGEFDGDDDIHTSVIRSDVSHQQDEDDDGEKRDQERRKKERIKRKAKELGDSGDHEEHEDREEHEEHGNGEGVVDGMKDSSVKEADDHHDHHGADFDKKARKSVSAMSRRGGDVHSPQERRVSILVAGTRPLSQPAVASPSVLQSRGDEHVSSDYVGGPHGMDSTWSEVVDEILVRLENIEGNVVELQIGYDQILQHQQYRGRGHGEKEGEGEDDEAEGPTTLSVGPVSEMLSSGSGATSSSVNRGSRHDREMRKEEATVPSDAGNQKGRHDKEIFSQLESKASISSLVRLRTEVNGMGQQLQSLLEAMGKKANASDVVDDVRMKTVERQLSRKANQDDIDELSRKLRELESSTSSASASSSSASRSLVGRDGEKSGEGIRGRRRSKGSVKLGAAGKQVSRDLQVLYDTVDEHEEMIQRVLDKGNDIEKLRHSIKVLERNVDDLSQSKAEISSLARKVEREYVDASLNRVKMELQRVTESLEGFLPPPAISSSGSGSPGGKDGRDGDEHGEVEGGEGGEGQSLGEVLSNVQNLLRRKADLQDLQLLKDVVLRLAKTLAGADRGGRDGEGETERVDGEGLVGRKGFRCLSCNRMLSGMRVKAQPPMDFRKLPHQFSARHERMSPGDLHRKARMGRQFGTEYQYGTGMASTSEMTGKLVDFSPRMQKLPPIRSSPQH